MNTKPASAVSIPKRTDGWTPGPRDISETPGGEHFLAMTPGGTKIMWSRNQMLNMAHSPLARSPIILPEGLEFLSKNSVVDLTVDARPKDNPVNDEHATGFAFEMD